MHSRAGLGLGGVLVVAASVAGALGKAALANGEGHCKLQGMSPAHCTCGCKLWTPPRHLTCPGSPRVRCCRVPCWVSRTSMVNNWAAVRCRAVRLVWSERHADHHGGHPVLGTGRWVAGRGRGLVEAVGQRAFISASRHGSIFFTPKSWGSTASCRSTQLPSCTTCPPIAQHADWCTSASLSLGDASLQKLPWHSTLR